MTLTVQSVNTPALESEFYTLPRKIYNGNSYWVQPLISDIQSIFDPQRNAFYQKGDTRRFLALQDGKPVGRIAAMVNHAKDFKRSPSLGGFGFFESINDQKVANALLDEASEWLANQNLEGIRGPINFGATDRWWGLLYENFTIPPTYGINYNPPYYVQLLRNYGLKKRHDQLSYQIDLDQPLPKRLVRIAQRVFSRPGIEIRMVNMNDLPAEAETIRQIYNTAWQEMDISDFFDEFTPLTRETVQQMIKELRPILIPEGAWLAYVNGEPASFVLTIPDINQVLYHLNGKINLLSLPKFLWYRRKISRLRVIAYGTIKKYRRLGLEAGIFVKGIQRIQSHLPGYREIIAAWTGEENWLMQRSIEATGGTVFQKHRTFMKLFHGDR